MENSLLHYLLLHRNFLTLSTEWFSNNIFLLRDSGNKEYVGNVGHGKEFTRASRFEGGGDRWLYFALFKPSARVTLFPCKQGLTRALIKNKKTKKKTLFIWKGKLGLTNIFSSYSFVFTLYCWRRCPWIRRVLNWVFPLL